MSETESVAEEKEGGIALRIRVNVRVNWCRVRVMITNNAMVIATATLRLWSDNFVTNVYHGWG